MPTLELTLQRKTESGYPVVAALTRPGGFLRLRREGMLHLDVAFLVELQYGPLKYSTALGQALSVDEIATPSSKRLALNPCACSLHRSPQPARPRLAPPGRAL